MGTTTFAVVLSAVLSSCVPRALQDVLWLPQDAAADPWSRNSPSGADEGVLAVSFSVPYPRMRDDLTNQFIRHFAERGWHQRRTEWMNPHVPTAFRAGWQIAGGGVLLFDRDGRPAQQEVHRWAGEWENEDGDIVRYSLIAIRNLRYPSVNRIRGYAEYAPAASVARARVRREQVERFERDRYGF
jgi:hypothetical protein